MPQTAAQTPAHLVAAAEGGGGAGVLEGGHHLVEQLAGGLPVGLAGGLPTPQAVQPAAQLLWRLLGGSRQVGPLQEVEQLQG